VLIKIFHGRIVIPTPIAHCQYSCVCPASTATTSACILSGLDSIANNMTEAYAKQAADAKSWTADVSKGAKQASYTLRNGLWLEFGAWSGRSTRRIADVAHARLNETTFSFDSFMGLPEAWRASDPHQPNAANMTRLFLSSGSFSRHGTPPFTDRRIEWRVGWFNETLRAFLAEPHAARRNVSYHAAHTQCIPLSLR
jgi:hypothetical protein